MTNKDITIYQTNFQQILERVYSCIKSINSIKRQITSTSDNTTAVRSTIDEILEKIAECQSQYTQFSQNGMLSVTEAKQRVNDILIRIQTLKTNIALLQLKMSTNSANILKLTTASSSSGSGTDTGGSGSTTPTTPSEGEETGGEEETGGSSGSDTPTSVASEDNANVWVAMLNHWDDDIHMDVAAKSFRDMLITGDGVSSYAVENHIDWTNQVNEVTTRKQFFARLDCQISNVPENGLFIFWYGGHGGTTDKNHQFFKTRNGDYIYDYQLWDKFSKCKGKMLLIFDCCHAGSMYALDQEGGLKNEYENNETYDEDEELAQIPFGLNVLINDNDELQTREMNELQSREVEDDGETVIYNNSIPFKKANWHQVTPQNKEKPVYIRLTGSTYKLKPMIVLSASHEEGLEFADGNGGLFTQALVQSWQGGSKDSYRGFYNRAYPIHRSLVEQLHEKITGGYSWGNAVCTFTAFKNKDKNWSSIYPITNKIFRV